MKTTFSGVFCALLLTASAASPPATEQKEIQDLYRRGLAGEKTAVEQCIEKLESALRTQPQNQLARVYLGSSYTLRSRDLGFGPKKLEALKRGLAMMDEAVAAAPEEPKVRLVRALTTSSLPAIFGRSASARKDFDLLAEAVRLTPAKFEEGDLEIIRKKRRQALSQKQATIRFASFRDARIVHPSCRTISSGCCLTKRLFSVASTRLPPGSPPTIAIAS